MKRVKGINGYTIMEATARDVDKYNVIEGNYYIYFSSDLRDYGIANSYPEWETDHIDTAIEWCQGSNYALAKEIVEAQTTAATFEEIAAIEKQLDAGITPEEIEDQETVSVIEENNLFYVRIENVFDSYDHGPYFNRAGAEMAADNYKRNINR